MKSILQGLTFAVIALAMGEAHANFDVDDVDVCKPDDGRCVIAVTVLPPDGAHPTCYVNVKHRETLARRRDDPRVFVWKLTNPRSEGYSFVDDARRAIELTGDGADQDFDQADHEDGKQRVRVRIAKRRAARSEYNIRVQRGNDLCDVKDPVIAND